MALFLAVAVVFARDATAQSRIEDFARATEPQELLGYDTINMSGCCLMPSTGELLVALNRTIYGYPYVQVYDRDGTFKRAIRLRNFTDVESICQYMPESNLFAVVEEGLEEIYVIEITTNTTEIVRGTPHVAMDLGIPFNSGIEGITYVRESEIFYAVQETPQRVYRVTGSGAEAVVETLFTLSWPNDLSDVRFDAFSGHLFIVSQESRAAVEVTMDGTRVGTLDLALSRPEGIELSDDGRTLYVVGEDNEYMRLSTCRADRFLWDPIPSPQLVFEPFPAVIRAFMDNGAPATDYECALELSLVLESDPSGAVYPDVTADFVDGVWSGTVQVAVGGDMVRLRAESDLGIETLSDPFVVVDLPALAMEIPPALTEGMGLLSGMATVSVSEAVGADFRVSLLSDNPYELAVTNEVVIAAGDTEVAFDLEVGDDAGLDGSQRVEVEASAPGYRSGTARCLVHDNETATLSVTAPESVREGGRMAGAGRVLVDAPPSAAVTVSLTCSEADDLEVTPTVVLAAGETEAPFDLFAPNNNAIDGLRRVSLTARVENWTPGSAFVDIVDNEHTNLLLFLPGSVQEGSGARADAGLAAIAGFLPDDLVVSLSSTQPSWLTVADEAVIAAGATSARFDVTVIDDTVFSGVRSVCVTGTAPGFAGSEACTDILDNDGRIEGRKWHDVNANGERDPDEEGLGSWRIYADLNTNGLFDTGEPFDWTGADGSYALDSPSGLVYVAEAPGRVGQQTSPTDDVGRLSFVTSVHDGEEGIDGLYAATSVALSPDGRHAYVAGKWDDAVAVFSVQDGGDLAPVEVERDGVAEVDGLDGPVFVTVSPDGRHVYAAAEVSDSVCVFERDETSGALVFVESIRDGAGEVDGLDEAAWVTVSPDGSNVYAVGRWDDALVVFLRDTVSGSLTFVEARRYHPITRSWLNGPCCVVVSRDGRQVYVAAADAGAVGWFQRDMPDGALTGGDAVWDGVADVEALGGVCSVAVSPDGAHVYAAAELDDAITVFERDPAAGELRLLGELRDGTNGVDGLDGASAVTVSDDGRTVYAAGTWDDAVTAFRRDPDRGTLTPFQIVWDDTNGVDGLNGVAGLAASGDGSVLLSAALWDHAAALLTVVPGRRLPWARAVLVQAGSTTNGVDFGNEVPRRMAISLSTNRWRIGRVPIGGMADTWYDTPGAFCVSNSGTVHLTVYLQVNGSTPSGWLPGMPPDGSEFEMGVAVLGPGTPEYRDMEGDPMALASRLEPGKQLRFDLRFRAPAGRAEGTQSIDLDVYAVESP